MKHFAFLVMVFACLMANVEAKEKTIKIIKNVTYQGNVENNMPFGEGMLQVTSKNNPAPTILLKGKFQNMVVNGAELNFQGGYSFKGNLSYLVSKKPAMLTINLNEGGAFYDKNAKLIGLVDKEGFSIVVSPEDETHISAEGLLEERAPIASIKDYIRYAQDDSYKVEYSVIPLDLPANANLSLKEDCHTILPLIINDNGWDYSPTDSAPAFTVSFSNGTVIRADGNDCELWEKPSGDYIFFDYGGSGITASDYRITLGDSYLKNGIIHHRFENGNVFEGPFRNDYFGIIFNYQGLIELQKLANLDWAWKDFFSGVTSDGGTVSFTDGSRYEGSFILPKLGTAVEDNRLSEMYYDTGKLFGSDGKIIHTFENGKNELQIAEEKRKVEEEKERRRLAYEESKQTDYFDFDIYDANYIRAFKRTCPDMAIIEGRDEKRSGKYTFFRITYPDGTILSLDNCDIIASVDYFKKSIYSLQSAPSFNTLNVSFFKSYSSYGDGYDVVATQGNWTFPDGLRIESEFSDHEANLSACDFRINIQTPRSENGDFAVLTVDNIHYMKDNRTPIEGKNGLIYYEGDKTFSNNAFTGSRQSAIKSFMKSFPDCTVMADFNKKCMDLIGKPYTWLPLDAYSFFRRENNYLWSGNFQACDGTISYNQGGFFKGIFTVRFSDMHKPAINDDPRIKALKVTIVASLENMVLGEKYEGKEYDADGKLIAIYKEGKPLDAFDVAQALAKENAKKAEEEAKLKKEQERLAKYENDCKKYGKKYVDAWEFSRTILVGTPEEFFLNNVGGVKLYYESDYTRSYRVYTLGGDLGWSIDVSVATKKVTHFYDHRR